MFCKFVLAAISAMHARWRHRMILTTLIIILPKYDLCGRYHTDQRKPMKNHTISYRPPGLPFKLDKN